MNIGKDGMHVRGLRGTKGRCWVAVRDLSHAAQKLNNSRYKHRPFSYGKGKKGTLLDQKLPNRYGSVLRTCGSGGVRRAVWMWANGVV